MFDHCKNCNRDSDYQFVICDHCNELMCIKCYNQHNNKDDDSVESYNSWWSVNHPIEAQEMFHSAKLLLDDIEYEQLFVELMTYFKTLINI